jgi:YD repeat-containing protein
MQKVRKILFALSLVFFTLVFESEAKSQNFSVSVTPSSRTISQGQSTTYTVTVQSLSGFSGQVALFVHNLPQDRVVAGTGFNPGTVNVPANGSVISTLTITTDGLTQTGTYSNLYVRGQNGGTNRNSANFTLVVQPPGDFTVSVSPTSRTISQGQSTTYTVTVQSVNGFSGQVSLFVHNLPQDRVVAGTGFNPGVVNVPANGSVISTLIITTDGLTQTGTYSNLYVRGQNGSTNRNSANFTLVVQPPGDFTVSVSPTSRTISNGLSTTYTVTVQSVNGFSGQVSLFVHNLPQDRVVAGTGFNPGVVNVPANGSVISTLTITTDGLTQTGTYSNLYVRGQNGSTNRNSANFTLVVQPPGDFAVSVSPASHTVTRGQFTTYTVTVQSVNGFSGQVTLNVKNLPGNNVAGTNFQPQIVTVPANGSATSTLNLGTNSQSPLGTFSNLFIEGASGSTIRNSANFSVIVQDGDFTVSVSPLSRTVTRGQFTTYTVTVQSINGFSGQVTLNVKNLPGNIVAGTNFQPQIVTVPANGSATSTLNLGTNSQSPLGTFNNLFIEGASGSTIRNSANFTLIVQDGDFTVSVSPASRTVTRGQFTTYTVTVQSVNGFSGQVTLNVKNLPGNNVAGTNFQPQIVTVPANGSATSTLNLGTNSQSPLGTFSNLFIEGASGSTIRNSANFTLIVQDGDFTVSVSPASRTVTRGQFTTYTVTVQSVNGFSGQVTLNVKNLPGNNVAGTNFQPQIVTVPANGSATSTLNLGTNSQSPLGTFNNLFIEGASGSAIRNSANFSVIVQDGDFTVSVSPASRTVTRGQFTTYTVTVQSINGFSGQVTLNVKNLPGNNVAGTNFQPQIVTVPANGSATSTLNLGTNSQSPLGTFNNLFIEGASGSAIRNSANFSVTVQSNDVIPTISSITPNQVPLNQTTPLTVNGSNFQNGFSASVTTPEGTYPISSAGLMFVTSNQVKVEVKMGGTTAYTATLNITNPGGKAAAASFQVIIDPNSAPSIANLSPTQVPFNVPTTLVVNGSNFQPGFTASVASPGRTDPIAPEGLAFIGINQVQVQVLMKGSPPYNAELIIVNPNGKSAKAGFQVTKPTVSPNFSIQPTSGVAGTNFTNVGRNFTPFGEVRIKVRFANGTVVDGIVKRADANGYFSYDYTSQPGDPLGKHTLEVTDAVTGQTVSAQEEFLGGSGGDALSVTNATVQANANSLFTIRWRVKNTGTTTWNNYRLVFVSAPASGISSQNLTTTGANSFALPPAFPPGKEDDLPLNMKAPGTKGTYYSYWQLQNAQGQPFGAQFYAQITVIEPSKSNVKNGSPSGCLGGDSICTNSNTESDPVNTANGNYIYDREDLRVPGRGVDFIFSRAYNSADNTPSSLGNGWSHSFNLTISDTNTANPVVRYSDGKALEYESGPGGNYVPKIPGFYDTLLKNPDGSWTLRKTDQRSYNFNSSGKLVSIQDRNNNLISLGYDGNGRLQEVTDTVGRKFLFNYDGQRLSTLTDPINRTLQFTYDSAGNLISSKDAKGNTMRYEYDANSRVTRIVDGRQKNLLINEYDSEGRVKTQTNGRNFKWAFIYDPAGRVTTITDPLGKQVKDQHDEYFNLNNTTNKLQQNAAIGYDTGGNRSQAQDLKGAVYGFSYDARGNLTSIVNPNQTSSQIEYDVRNNPMKVTDELSRQTSMEYDQKGNLTRLRDALNQASQITYNPFGQPETIADPNGNQSRLDYGNQGNLMKVTDALGRSTQFEHDAAGRRTKVIDARGKATSFIYDANDNVVSVTDPSGKTTAYSYDQNDNLIEVRDARGKVTRYDYNENNLLVKVTDALGKAIEHSYDPLDRRISTRDKRGNLTEFGYDAEGRLISVKDPNGNITRYEYDANGNRTKVVDPKGQATEFAYDALNRLVKIKDPLGNTIERRYDAAGQLREEIDQRGNATKFDYDLAGNLLVVTDAAAGTVKYGYDKNRNRISVEDPNKRVSKTAYDKLNRIESAEDPLLQKYVYTYDEAGNRKTMTDANQKTTRYDY